MNLNLTLDYDLLKCWDWRLSIGLTWLAHNGWKLEMREWNWSSGKMELETNTLSSHGTRTVDDFEGG